MKEVDVRRTIGIIFWTLAGLCFGMALLGLVLHDPRFTVSGICGGGWFMLMASLPREYFMKFPDE